MLYPNRHLSHTLEDKSINFFKNYLPSEWNTTSPGRDYGKDISVEITENHAYKGLEFIVQLKSSAQPNAQLNFEKQQFRVSTYNYLWDNLRVALIVKYVESEDEAYWILLKDVVPPNQENKTFTVYIPKTNTLSTLDWSLVTDYVREVTDIKLAAARAHMRANRQGHSPTAP